MKDVIFWSGGGLVARTRQSGGGYQKGTMSELQAIEVPGLPVVVVGAGAPVPWKADALARLPVGPADTDPFWRLAAAFLVGYPDSTAKAYLGALKAWAAEGVQGRASLRRPASPRRRLGQGARPGSPAGHRKAGGGGHHRPAPVVSVEVLRLRDARS
jgi:hypothetical protein